LPLGCSVTQVLQIETKFREAPLVVIAQTAHPLPEL
jgi:hypothetical protein